MITLYRVWTEWDIGLEDMVYTSKLLAMGALKKAHDEVFANEPDAPNFDEALNNGFYGVERVRLSNGTEE